MRESKGGRTFAETHLRQPNFAAPTDASSPGYGMWNPFRLPQFLRHPYLKSRRIVVL
jgi:hypothetical protein